MREVGDISHSIGSNRAGQRAAHALGSNRPAPSPDRNSFPFGAPPARIYKPARSITQAGRDASRHWVLEFEPSGSTWVDPLMGWTASDDPFPQVRLRFDSLGEALAYAEREGLDYSVLEPATEGVKRKSYRETILGPGWRNGYPSKRGRDTDRKEVCHD